MLSDIDLNNALGKDIMIYPFSSSNTEGASVFIDASKLAWSRKTKAKIFEDGKIIIPKNDTAIIVSKESLYVSRRYAATCHARVLNVAKGLGHISTVIKLGSFAPLLISIRNHTDEDIPLNLDKIAVITFHRLRSKAATSFLGSNTTSKVFSGLGIKLTADDDDLLEENTFKYKEAMLQKLQSCSDYVAFKKRYRHWWHFRSC